MEKLTEHSEISCQKATFLASKLEEKKASDIEQLQLEQHYKICDGCRLFDIQNVFIGNNARYAMQYTNELLSKVKKEALKKLMKLQK